MGGVNNHSANRMATPIYPIADLHCDILFYLAEYPNADPYKKEDIGCAIPYLQNGNVKVQVAAFYTGSGANGVDQANKQMQSFVRLLENYKSVFESISNAGQLNDIEKFAGIYLIPAIENASCLCREDEPLENTYKRLDEFIINVGRPLYITMTHHLENRFGGGNNTDIGLKDNGKKLLDYLHNKKIAIDLSHTSIKLANDILNHLEKSNLNIPVMASHSNFRSIYTHNRNLTDEITQEIVRKEGIIGINFLRAFLDPNDVSAMQKHILYGFDIAGDNSLCFGADYFCTKQHPDKSRIPFYFKEHENAGEYGNILKSLVNDLDNKQLENLAFGNFTRFLKRVWDGYENG